MYGRMTIAEIINVFLENAYNVLTSKIGMLLVALILLQKSISLFRKVYGEMKEEMNGHKYLLNIPDDVWEDIREYAYKNNCTYRDVILKSFVYGLEQLLSEEESIN